MAYLNAIFTCGCGEVSPIDVHKETKSNQTNVIKSLVSANKGY